MARFILDATLNWLTLFVFLLLSTEFTNAQESNNHASVCDDSQNPVVTAINSFGFSLAERLEAPSNTFFSPLGVSMAFGMAYLGAAGNTSSQMEAVLGYQASSTSGEQVHENIKQLCESIVQGSTNLEYSLNIANGLFYQIGWALNGGYIDGVRNYYHGEVSSVDFSNEPEQTLTTINNWAKEKTSNKIPTLFDEPLSTDTKVILTNAIYFKGTWKIEFPPSRTYNGYFYVAGERLGQSVPLMSLADERFPYLKDEEIGYKFLEMPYKGDKVSMLFALPLKYDEIPKLEMNQEMFCGIRSRMIETEVENTVIPKFKFTFEKKLKEMLISMGMVNAFSPGAADFSGITNSSNLYISDVIHKAYIEVNEQGSEAAAITGIQIMPVSLREITDFVANHPFLFYILDKTSGAILFAGKVMDPTV